MNHKGDLRSGRKNFWQWWVAPCCLYLCHQGATLAESGCLTEQRERHSSAPNATLNFLSLELFHLTNHVYVIGMFSDSGSRLIAMICPSPPNHLVYTGPTTACGNLHHKASGSELHSLKNWNNKYSPCSMLMHSESDIPVWCFSLKLGRMCENVTMKPITFYAH